MKEFLDPNDNYKFHKISIGDAPHWMIEIPDGADVLIRLNSGLSAFYKDNFKKVWHLGVWCLTGNAENFKDKCRLWEREEFFIDESEIISEEMKLLNSEKHSHYFKDVSNLLEIDVYRVLKLFDVTDPCIQHAVKKLLCAGGRGVKDVDKDVHEAIDSLLRYEEMRKEDENE